jgi:hypothetical protein
MLRTAIQRTAPDARPKPAKGPRTVKCGLRGCLHRFVPDPAAPLVKWCSLDCGALMAIAAGAARKRKLGQVARISDRARKESVKRRGDHLAAAQTEFNAYIRLRDQLAGHACISSGKPLDWSGNNVDAGHYRSRGSAPHLRFNEDNVHAQSKQENRYASGNAVDYRVGLIARIGLARVEALEADQTPRKWSIEELQEIKSVYKAKTKALKGQS